MKKRIFSLLLVVAMLVGMFPMHAFAAMGDYEMKLVGTVESFYDDVNGITFSLQYKGPSVGTADGIGAVLLKLDTSKVELASYSEADTLTGGTGASLTQIFTDNDAALVDGQHARLNAINFYGKTDAAKNVMFLSIQTVFSRELRDTAGEFVEVGKFRLAYKGATTVDDLDNTTVQIASVLESEQAGQNCVAALPTSLGDTYQYGINNNGGGEENMPKPIIEYPGSDVMNLNGVKLDADNRYVNVPVSMPTAGDDVTVATTATGYYTSDCTDGTEIDSGVTYTYSLAMKDGSEVPNTVSIGADGVLTIKAGAPEATVVITATGSYTNTKGNTTTASGTFELQLRHGDAEDKSETDDPKPDDPPKPIGGGDDVEKTASGVAVYEDGTQVTTSVAASNYQKAVAIPTTTETITFEGKVVDQYGDAMTETGAWAVDTTPASGNPSFADGVVTVSSGAEKGTYTYTYSYGTDPAYSAAVEITVDDNAITWPTLTNDTIFYGQTTADLTYAADGEVNGKGTITDVSFAWKADQTLSAATTEAVMECSYTVDGDAKTAEHNYSITVNKAGQAIVTDVDDSLEGKVLQLPIGESVDLNTVVKNADVEGITADGEISYVVTDTAGLISMEGDVISGEKMSSSESEMATITIKAAGTDNYTAADREIQVFVTKPMLRATITFDTVNPVFGKQITATITEAEGQTGSLTADVDYTWGHVGTGEGEAQFTPITTGNSEGKLTAAVSGSTTVTYTPVKEDIGKTLALKITTPTNVEGYGYIHSVKADMENPVVKASQTVGAWGATTTTTTITADVIAGAEYAISESTPAATVAEDEEGTTETTLAWQDSNEFSDLTPNKYYDIHVRLKATETHNASAEDVKTVKTDALSLIDPDEPDPDNPDPDNPKNAAVTLSGIEKYGETLTATPRDPEGKDGALTTDTVYVWERTTVPTDGSEAVTTVIEGAESNTYTLVAEDIGCVITVKASPAPTSEYAGTVKDTSGVIAKADGPVLSADGVDTTPETKAGEADGTITGLPTNSYEYIVKPEAGTEPDWTNATKATIDGETNTVIDNLAAGTYLVRIVETNVRLPSNAIEVTVNTAGHDITGVVVSYNAKNAVTYELYAWDDAASDYSATVAYTGTAVEAAETTTAGVQTQSFTIEGIADGTYKLVIKKISHIDFTVLGVVVNGADLDLTQDSRDPVKSMRMGAGDIDGNNRINFTDANIVTNPNNYNKTDVTQASNQLADLDGNGSVNFSDKNIIVNVANYNKNATDHFTIPAAE